ncbi:dTDP-4-dehydrorhamnose reductase [Ruegeria sp. HKCCA6837]|uniref:dTDP-4-dehydrorhamnose reductase n=1 Tax=Ruegeria sp. HKCCA6837 TaxID=2682989 RepID=UPI0014893E7D|nr:dTDP-4-dehydrorhamnose reductase [Ruegeria sp. HKCCA6837]
MTILVFGRTGQVARELAAHADVTCLDRSKANLEQPETCVAAIRTAAPQAVINAAAYTAVDRAEEEEALATVTNADAPAAMARECAILGIPLVSISTDYVFDGSGETPWVPTDPTRPLGAYGRSKLAGEQGITQAGGIYGILRNSWVVSAHGSNFVRTMRRLGAERDQLAIVADQIGGPTPARDIAVACLSMARQLAEDAGKTGIYHFAGEPDVSWAGFARAIFAELETDCDVMDIPSSEYPTPARRPLNSRLDCSSLKTVFGIIRPDWRQGLRDILRDLENAS